MSRWTHPICEACWEKQNPGRYAARVSEPDAEHCCFCQKPTEGGIYIRHDPLMLPCNGEHP